jgi:uncharacterized protein with GYD domain
MPIYIALFNLTDQGVKNMKEAPARLAEHTKAMEAAGGKMIGFYLTMGAYDYVAVSEWPNDEAAMSFLLVLGSMGNVRTTTLKAFNQEEFAAIVKNLP